MHTGVADHCLTTWLRRQTDSDENRTRVTAVKGRCLNRLTMGPYFCLCILTHLQASVNRFLNPLKSSSPSRTRTYDNAVNSRALYRLSYRGIVLNVPSKPHIEIHLLPKSTRPFWISPRPISSSQLHALLHFHLCPIYLVVFKGSYFFRMGYLILRGASRLDAFSVYPFQTWLPGRGFSNPTGTPAVRPSRSSRTKDSSSQISYAHAG